jgi:thiol-disulfide isomerase/thioredoxin
MSQQINWVIRILISGVFLLSAVTKLVPLWSFEKQLVDLGLADWCWSHYIARLIIALEFAIGFGILQKHFLKRLVIPITVLLLAAFCVHLCIVGAQDGFTNGNCGCFGQLIPMTPLEAIIKNLVTLALLIFIYFKLEKDDRNTNRIWVPFTIYGACALILFMVYPFCPCFGKSETTEVAGTTTTVYDQYQNTEEPVDALPAVAEPLPIAAAEDTATKLQAVEKVMEPQPTTSKFAAFTQFGSKKVNLDQGQKIVCCFAPGCEHCQATAGMLADLAKKQKLPPVYILFMDEEPEKIPDFMKTSGIKANFNVLDVMSFWNVMKEDDTPAVYYLWNGNVRYHSTGIDVNEFKLDKFTEAINKKD